MTEPLVQKLTTAHGLTLTHETRALETGYVMAVTVQTRRAGEEEVEERVVFINPDQPIDEAATKSMSKGEVAFQGLSPEGSPEIFALDMAEGTWLMAVVQVGDQWANINRPRIVTAH